MGMFTAFSVLLRAAVAQNIQKRAAPGVGAFASSIRRVSPLGTVANRGDRRPGEGAVDGTCAARKNRRGRCQVKVCLSFYWSD